MAPEKSKTNTGKCMPDTNVLIGYFRGDLEAAEIVQSAILSQSLTISAIVYAEFMVGANTKQQAKMRLLVDRFGIEPITQEVVDKAVHIRKMALRKSKRVLLLDCFVAAGATVVGAELVTADKDFFKFAGLKVRRLTL